MTNLKKKSEQPLNSRSNTPTIEGGEAPAAEEDKEGSPAPDFGGRNAKNPSNMSNAFKIGDAIGYKEKRPTNLERERNIGMFGRGGGDFDAHGNMKSPAMFEQPTGVSPTLGKKNKSPLLGDFTLYRVNKEFENF